MLERKGGVGVLSEMRGLMEVISEEVFELRWGGGEAGGRRGRGGIGGSRKTWKVLDMFEKQKEGRMAGIRNESAEGRRPGCMGCRCGHQQVLFYQH